MRIKSYPNFNMVLIWWALLVLPFLVKNYQVENILLGIFTISVPVIVIIGFKEFIQNKLSYMVVADEFLEVQHCYKAWFLPASHTYLIPFHKIKSIEFVEKFFQKNTPWHAIKINTVENTFKISNVLFKDEKELVFGNFKELTPIVDLLKSKKITVAFEGKIL